MARQIPAQAVAWVLLGLLSACGGSGNDGPAPTPTTTPRPTPNCGNGIVDEGEFCDGEAFCTNCGVAFGGCCEVAEPDGGTLCAEMSLSPHACAETPAGRFSVGTSCEGSSCNEDSSVCRGDGRCVIQPIEPVSLCCQLDAGGCTALVASDTSALANFVVFGCDSVELGKSMLGTCGDDGICVPR